MSHHDLAAPIATIIHQISSTVKSFSYKALNIGHGHSTKQKDIRLLLVEPSGEEGHDIACLIKHCDISEASWTDEWKHYVSSLKRPIRPSDRLHWRKTHEGQARYVCGDYFAVSYTWGNVDEQATIALDGFTTSTTKNLEAALRNLRDSKALPSSYMLWVDALCINQGDMAERASEIQRMQTIYSSAIDTIVFLGCGSPVVTAGINFINIVGRFWSDIELLQQAIDEYLEETEFNILHQIAGVADLRYWWRQWVVHELVAGSDERPIYYGHVCTYSKRIWQVFEEFERRHRYESPQCAAFCDALEKHPRHFSGTSASISFDDFGGPTCRPAIAYANSDQRTMTTSQILTSARKNFATKRHDYVYALLGMLNPSLAAQITVDYAVMAETTFKMFTKTAIMNEESVDILGQCDIFGSPTWVPRMHINSPWYKHIHGEDEPPYCANGGRKTTLIRFEDREDASLLHLSALLLDRLDGLSSADLETDFRNENRLYRGGYAEKMVQTSGGSNVYGSEEALKEALWRTCGGNRDIRGMLPAPVSHSMLLSSEALDAEYDFSDAGVLCNPWSCWVTKNRGLKIAGKKLADYLSHTNLAALSEDERTERRNNALTTIHRFEHACWSRRIAITHKGYICLVPWYAERDDCIAVLPGATFAILLRPADQPEIEGCRAFKIVSPCYVHGVMEGEIWSEVDNGRTALEKIILL